METGSLRLAARPIDRSILWLPGGWGEHGTGRPYPNELFVEHEVLRDVESHALEEVEGSYGLLTGRLLACDRTRIPFVMVEACHRAESPMPSGEDLAGFRDFFWRVREAVGRRGRVVVGWYHTHSLLGLQLSERDRRIHVAHFQDDWPCALVVVTRDGASQGGFFQRDRGDILFRRSTRPFREIINQRVVTGGGPYVTSVAWENYWTHEPVLHTRKPGDLAAKRRPWLRRSRPRLGPPGGVSSPAAPTSAGSPADIPGSDISPREGLRSTPAAPAGGEEGREPPGPTYERAMGRPALVDPVVGSGRGIPVGPPPREAWEEWKKELGARREREDEIRKAEAERAATDAAEAEADATARAKAALAARAAAEAAARAAAEALGIGSAGDAIAADAAPRAEAEAEALVRKARAAEPVGKKERSKEAPPPAKGEPVSAAEERERRAEVEPEEDEPVEVRVAGGGKEAAKETEAASEAKAASEVEAARAAIDEQVTAAEVEPEGPWEMEAVPEEAARAEEDGAPEAAAEHGVGAEPEMAVQQGVSEVPAESESGRAEERAEPADFRVGEALRRLFGRAGVAAGTSRPLADDGEMIVPPLVLPDPPPRVRVRRYAVWVGIGIPLAAAVAWILLG